MNESGLTLDPTGNELYRRELLALSNENATLRRNIQELQEQLQNSYKRISELTK